MSKEEGAIYTEEDVMRHVEQQEQLRKTSHRSFVYKCIAWFFIIVFLTYMVPTMTDQYRRGSHRRDLVYAISNAKQIYLALCDFEADYGNFPDDHSARKDPALSGFTGIHSNAYLGQLLAGEYTRTEQIFHARDKRYSGSKPDDLISPVWRILEKNECGFSYVMVEDKGTRRGLNSKDNVAIPILAAPMLNPWGTCDAATFKYRGVYLRVDGSARSERLRSSDGKINLGGGMTLFDTGPSTAWGPLKPLVLLPER
jgi:hypothetical protein